MMANWLKLMLLLVVLKSAALPAVAHSITPSALEVPELLLDWQPGEVLRHNEENAGAKTDTNINGPWQLTKRLPPLHHVVGVKLLLTMRPPKTFALGAQQELVCATCHGQDTMARLKFDQVDKQAANFLRGGPYTQLTDFCYQCHSAKSYERPNIHQMLDAQGNIKEQQCKYCHIDVLKRDRVYQPEALKLRIPRETLCFGCHLKTPHLNAIEHQGKPSEAKLKQLRASEKQQGISLPLSNKGEIMCVTCHSPHPIGVLDAKLPAAKQVNNTDLKTGISYREHPWSAVYQADKQERLAKFNHDFKLQATLGYQRINAEVLLRLPAKNGALCLACHTFTDRPY